jgi:hypothetical protein
MRGEIAVYGSDWNDFILGSEPRACISCYHDTRWLEMNFEAACHPGICDVRLWRGFVQANQFIERMALENARDYFGDPERATGA